MKYDCEEKLSNGNTIYYRIYEGTYYKVGIKRKDGAVEEYTQVNDALMNTLKRYEHKEWRVRIWYGDRKTGKAWNEEYDVTGRIGRSCGDIKLPLLIHDSRCYGGPALYVGSIIRIDDIEDKKTLWKVSNFHVPEMTVHCNGKDNEYKWEVWQKEDSKSDFEHIASFKTENQALRWIDFMNGRRYSK